MAEFNGGTISSDGDTATVLREFLSSERARMRAARQRSVQAVWWPLCAISQELGHSSRGAFDTATVLREFLKSE